ncbi:MAG: hypothetical protein JWP37_3072 [Mucilaginibacter sp.]|nr:hypothetical protein [Mucilaginibacter sp.]
MAKSESKSAEKKIRDDIKSGLISELKTLTGKFGDASEELIDEINKGAKKLARRIAKKIKPSNAPIPAKVQKAPAPKKAQPAKVVTAEIKEAKAVAKPAVKKKKV